MPVRNNKPKQTQEFSGLICVGSLVAFDCKTQETHAAVGRIRWAKNNSVKIDPAQTWDACFRCHRPMGCPGCVMNPICTKCLVVTDYEYFIQHGPLSNDRVSINHRGERRGPPITVYPQEWQRDYMLAHPETATVEDQELYDRVKRMAEDMGRKSKMPRDMTHAERQRERNEQVEELGQSTRFYGNGEM